MESTRCIPCCFTRQFSNDKVVGLLFKEQALGYQSTAITVQLLVDDIQRVFRNKVEVTGPPGKMQSSWSLLDSGQRSIPSDICPGLLECLFFFFMSSLFIFSVSSASFFFLNW